MSKAKHPKLPNGFGSIKKLSGNSSNPYGVYPPVTEFHANGSPVTPKALCYVSDWYTGFYALMEYRNGTFNPGNFTSREIKPDGKQDDVITLTRRSCRSLTKQIFCLPDSRSFTAQLLLPTFPSIYIIPCSRKKVFIFSQISSAITSGARFPSIVIIFSLSFILSNASKYFSFTFTSLDFFSNNS